MQKEEIVKKIAARRRLSVDVVSPIVDELIAELASPHLFPTPGGEVGFINDNNCKNNCKEAFRPVSEASTPSV